MNLIIINNRDNFSKDNIIDIEYKKIYISKNFFLGDIKEYIKKILIKNNINPQNISNQENHDLENSDFFTIWKIENKNLFNLENFKNILLHNFQFLKNDKNFTLDFTYKNNPENYFFNYFNYDTQNILGNMQLDTGDILLLELTTENKTSSFNIPQFDYSSGECSKCLNLKNLYF